jgi:hypothetical protein
LPDLPQPDAPRPSDDPDRTAQQQTPREPLPAWRLATAIAVPVVAIIGVIVLAAVVNSQPVTDVTDPLPVSSIDAPGATTAACASLTAALPDPLGGLQRRQLVQGDDPLLAGVAAWGEPAVILRCGVPTPQELTCSSPVQVVDGVAWLPIPGSGGTTYLAVDRPVRVALTVPDGTSTGPWQDMSKIVGRTLAERPICADGVPVPPDGG